MTIPLSEAGWYVWVIGLGDTERVRRFLLDELYARRKIGEVLVGRSRLRRHMERALHAASRSRALTGLREVLDLELTVRAVRAITKLRAGLPAPELEQLTMEEKDDLRDAFVRGAWPELRRAFKTVQLPEDPDTTHLPPLDELPHLLATGLNPTPVIQALERWKAPWLRGICDEAQHLLEEVLGERQLLPPEAFLQHMRTQLDPTRRAELKALRRARGWVSPPPPPFRRWPEFKLLFTPHAGSPGGSDDGPC